MSKRKSRGSRETSKLLEQMGAADDEAPAVPQVLPEAAVLAETKITPNTTITSTAAASPSPGKPRSRAGLWLLVIALAAVAAGVAAWLFVFGAHL